MIEPIDRRSLVEDIDKEIEFFTATPGNHDYRDYYKKLGLELAMKRIKERPIVQSDRQQGKWIIIDDCEQFIAKCSICSKTQDSRKINEFEFCPNCGSSMLPIEEQFILDEYVRLTDVLNICFAYCPDDDGSCSKAGTDLREMLDEIEALDTIDIPKRKPSVLKSCPCCGGKAEKRTADQDPFWIPTTSDPDSGGDPPDFVICTSCGISTKYGSAEDVINQWNTRVND